MKILDRAIIINMFKPKKFLSILKTVFSLMLNMLNSRKLPYQKNGNFLMMEFHQRKFQAS